MKNGYQKFFSEAQKEAQRKSRSPNTFSSDKKEKLVARKEPLAEQAENKNIQSGDQLAQILRERLKKNSSTKKTKRKSWKLAGFSFFGILVAMLGLYQLENVEKYLKKVEIHFLGSSFAEDAPTEKPAAKKEEGAQAVAQVEKSGTPSEEEINHFKKFREREKELSVKEEELQRAEKEIQAQKEALEKRMNELETKRQEISSLLNDRVKVDDQKVEQLTQMYSSMKPQQAAKVFESMDEDLAVNILGRMKKKSAAEIMNLMKAEKAKIFSERYAGYKRDVAQEKNTNNPTKEGGKTD